jgi:hypothetical protein
MIVLARNEQHLMPALDRAMPFRLRMWATLMLDTGTLLETQFILENDPDETQSARINDVWSTGTADTWVRHDYRQEICQLTFQEASCLKPGQGKKSWLGDAIINMFNLLLKIEVNEAETGESSVVVMNTFFSVKSNQADCYPALLKYVTAASHGPRQSRVFQQEEQGKELRLIVPVNLANLHWITLEVIVCSGMAHKLNVYDMPIGTTEYHAAIQSELEVVLTSMKEFATKYAQSPSPPLSPLQHLPRPTLVKPSMSKDKVLQVADAQSSLAERLGHPDESKRPWTSGLLRNQVVQLLMGKVHRDEDFELSLALLFTLGHPDANSNPKENAQAYISLMGRPGTYGGHPELVLIAEYYGNPLIVFEQMGSGEWRLSNHFNETAHGVPIFLVRTNIASEYAAHYSLAIPAVPTSDLGGDVGQLLEAAMELVHVNPVQIEVPCSSDLGIGNTKLWIFGVHGDGNCLFTSLEMYRAVSEKASQKRAVSQDQPFAVWERCLPKPDAVAQETMVANQKNWNRGKPITDLVASGGVGVYDETTIGGMQRLLALVFLLLPFLTGVMLDIGHGLAQTLYYSASGVLTCLGIEQDELLHKYAKNIGVFLGLDTKVALRFGCSSELKARDLAGVTIVTMYESMGGRKDGPNEVHLATCLEFLRTPSVQCITSTKLQLRLLSEYCLKSPEFKTLILGWIIIKVGGTVSRKGNKPTTYLYVRKSSFYNMCSVQKHPPSEFVLSLVNAANHRAEGLLHSFTYDLSPTELKEQGKSFQWWGADSSSNIPIRIVYAFSWQVVCHMTGLRVVPGATVHMTHGVSGVVIGFGSIVDPNHVPESKPGVFLLCMADGQHVVVEQENLLRVSHDGVKVLTPTDYLNVRKYAQNIKRDKRRDSSPAQQHHRTKSDRIQQHVVKAALQESQMAELEARKELIEEQRLEAVEREKKTQKQQQKRKDEKKASVSKTPPVKKVSFSSKSSKRSSKESSPKDTTPPKSSRKTKGPTKVTPPSADDNGSGDDDLEGETTDDDCKVVEGRKVVDVDDRTVRQAIRDANAVAAAHQQVLLAAHQREVAAQQQALKDFSETVREQAAVLRDQAVKIAEQAEKIASEKKAKEASDKLATEKNYQEMIVKNQQDMDAKLAFFKAEAHASKTEDTQKFTEMLSLLKQQQVLTATALNDKKQSEKNAKKQAFADGIAQQNKDLREKVKKEFEESRKVLENQSNLTELTVQLKENRQLFEQTLAANQKDRELKDAVIQKHRDQKELSDLTGSMLKAQNARSKAELELQNLQKQTAKRGRHNTRSSSRHARSSSSDSSVSSEYEQSRKKQHRGH